VVLAQTGAVFGDRRSKFASFSEKTLVLEVYSINSANARKLSEETEPDYVEYVDRLYEQLQQDPARLKTAL